MQMKTTTYQVWYHHGGESILLRETSFYSVARMTIDLYQGYSILELRKITNFATKPKTISSNETTSPHHNGHHSRTNKLHWQHPEH